MACYVTMALLFIDIQKGKEGTNKSNYHIQIGATSFCTNTTTEATKGIGQRYMKGNKKDFFLFEI